MESGNNVDLEEVLIEGSVVQNDILIKLVAFWEEEQKDFIKSQKCTDKLRNTLEEPILKEQFEVRTLQSTDDFEQLMIKLKQLENEEAKIMDDINNLEAKCNNLKNPDSEKDDPQSKVLRIHRYMCKASKELTKTTFNYRNAQINGIIRNRPVYIRSINLDPKKLSLDEVTQHLWKYLSLAEEEQDEFCVSNST